MLPGRWSLTCMVVHCLQFTRGFHPDKVGQLFQVGNSLPLLVGAITVNSPHFWSKLCSLGHSP